MKMKGVNTIETIDYHDTTEDLKSRLRKDLRIPKGAFEDDVLEAITIALDLYRPELPTIYLKYHDLFCHWDRMLHRSLICDQKYYDEFLYNQQEN